MQKRTCINRLFMVCSIAIITSSQACQHYTRTQAKPTFLQSCLVTLAGCMLAQQAHAQNSSVVHELFIGNGILPLAGQFLQLSTLAAHSARTWIGMHDAPEFCEMRNHYPEKTIDDPAIQTEDHENLIGVIKKYSPILYVHEQEIYFPLSAQEWCAGPHTVIRSHDNSINVEHVTPDIFAQFLYNTSLNASFIESNAYFENPPCTLYGSDPAHNTDAAGNLITPCYVITFEERQKLYLQFIFLYGFNQPYDLGPLTGDIIAQQNAHEADLEHMTLELDPITKELKRIYYSAHGTREGVWLAANHTDITYEGTRPVGFVARGAHGTYPKEGTYLRIYGAANDVTQKGMRWVPTIIRLYKHDDKRFDARTMAWTLFPGSMGKRGVSSPYGQTWYTKSFRGDIGRPYDGVLYCENPNWSETTAIVRIFGPALSVARYLLCIAVKAPFAPPPAESIEELP